MKEWIKFGPEHNVGGVKELNEDTLCDFLWFGDKESEGLTWMLCCARLKDQEYLDRDPDYWRPAEVLPPKE